MPGCRTTTAITITTGGAGSEPSPTTSRTSSGTGTTSTAPSPKRCGSRFETAPRPTWSRRSRGAADTLASRVVECRPGRAPVGAGNAEKKVLQAEPDQRVVVGAHEDHAVRHGGGASNRGAHGGAPELGPRGRVE